MRILRKRRQAVSLANGLTRDFEEAADSKEEINNIFEALAEELRRLLADFGKDLAIDSKAIKSLAKGVNKNKKRMGAGTRMVTGEKGYRGVKKDGLLGKVIKWFGYKLHLIGFEL